MVFSSLTFICVFMPLVFLAYLAVPSMKAKNVLLIVASLAFYAYGEPIYVLLMVASSIMNYVFGRIIGAYRQKKALSAENGTVSGSRRSGDSTDLPKSGQAVPSVEAASFGKKAKLVVAVSVVANLAFLGVFKYAGMAVGTADALLGQSWTIPVIALPIGISFYTFQAMSYVIDVYRGQVTASRNYPNVLLYIGFFPQLTAGPIIKYHDVEAELSERRVTVAGIATGLRRFVVGLCKKVLIANTMAAVVDSIYSADLTSVNIAVAWIAALAYIMQIYFDFSGYSDMAIGLARMFGFHYKENFNYPYVSSSIKEFWRRWHISLSTWFKEYLYIPLGGNRKGKARAGLNKVIVFFCCGLWHGASWTFVIWGLFHGLFLLIEEYIPVKRLPKAIGVAYALLVVTVGFVIFRADTIGQAGYFIAQMFTGFHFESASTSLAMEQLTPLFIVTFLIAVVACMPIKGWLRSHFEGRPHKKQMFRAFSVVGYAVSAVLLSICIVGLSGGGYNPFIYFRF